MNKTASKSEWSEFLTGLIDLIDFSEGEMDEEKTVEAYKTYFRFKDLCPFNDITGMYDTIRK